MLGILVTLILLAVPAPAAACSGDCDSGGTVTVDEILSGVNIALGSAAVGSCIAFDQDGDRQVTVDEIIAAVGNALAGCPPEATPTATATATPSPAGSPTPIGLLFDGLIVDLSPHNLGDELTYRVALLSGMTRVETDRVVKVGADGTFQIDTFAFGHVSKSQFHRDSGSALHLVDSTDFDGDIRSVCRDPILAIALPLTIGVIREDNTQCALRTLEGNRFLGSFLQSSKVIPVGLLAEVTVPAGTYHDVIELRAESNILNEQEAARILLVPGVGIIHSTRSSFGVVNETRELTDGTVGGQSVRR